MAGRRMFGRVRRLPSGRWQARYPNASGVLRAAPQTFARKADADRWLAAVESDINRGTFIDPAAGRITVGDWSHRWMAASAHHLKIKTRAGYESLIKTKIEPWFGDVALAQVKPIAVKEWLAELGAQGLSPSRIRQSYRLLSQIMRAAVENDLIASSPCRGIRLPRMPQTEPHILTRAEADRLVACTRPPHDLLVMLLAYAGLRIGEAFALRRASIDVAERSVLVSQTLVEIAGRLHFDVPKSHQSRTIIVPAFVADRLREHLDTLPDEPGALLFADSAGGPLHYNGWRSTYFNPAVRAAGLVDVTPHDLRASHATWVAERHGVMAAAARLGHAHASVTTRHYARTTTGQDRKVAEDFDSRAVDRDGTNL